MKIYQAISKNCPHGKNSKCTKLLCLKFERQQKVTTEIKIQKSKAKDATTTLTSGCATWSFITKYIFLNFKLVE